MTESVAEEAKLVAGHASIYGLANEIERSIGFARYLGGTKMVTGTLWLDLGLKILVGLSYPFVLYLVRMLDDSGIRRFMQIVKTRRLSFD